MVEIIIPTKKDLVEFKRIRLESLKEEPTAFGSDYRDSLRRNDEYWLNWLNPKNFLFSVVKDNNKFVGIAGAIITNKPKTGHTARIIAVYISPNYRGKGLGKLLMKDVLKKLKNIPRIIKVGLDVNNEQVSAKNLYLSLGFKEIGVSKKALKVKGSFYDEIIMELFF